MRDAFERATRRRNKLTLVHKHNVLVYAGGLWRRIFETVAAEYPQVSTDYLHVDAATIFLATDPARFDVIVTDNLFGDILTDLAAAVTGGIGLAASGNINPTRRVPVDVRAGARLGPRHRRAGRWPTPPRRSSRWRCCSSTWDSWTRRRAWRRPCWPTSRRARRGRSGRPPRSATRSPRGSAEGLSGTCAAGPEPARRGRALRGRVRPGDAYGPGRSGGARTTGTTGCSLRARRRGRPAVSWWPSSATCHVSGYISYMPCPALEGLARHRRC